MNKELMEKLYESFELREREGVGGMKFKYIPAHDVIDRMNKIFEGRWSTEVTSQERVDDFVVVRVRVSIYDSNGDRWFAHDGYGSSSVARYKGGMNAGQIIDLGNAYKSAEAKAIKNACTRWGVGLFLEVEDEEVGPFGVPDTGPAGSRVKKSSGHMPTAVVPPPFPEKNSAPSMPKGVVPSVPSFPRAEPKKEAAAVPKENSPEPKKNVSPMPPTPPSTPPSRGVTEQNEHPGITDVQRVAIQGLLQIKASLFQDTPENERFGKLVADALGKKDNLPKKIEDLSYQDAVTVIKYGNDIDKK